MSAKKHGIKQKGKYHRQALQEMNSSERSDGQDVLKKFWRCKHKMKSIKSALLIQSKKLKTCQQERDKYKLMVNQLQERQNLRKCSELFNGEPLLPEKQNEVGMGRYKILTREELEHKHKIVSDELQDVKEERTVYKEQAECLKPELNQGSQKESMVDMDALSMEKKYIQERSKQAKDQQTFPKTVMSSVQETSQLVQGFTQPNENTKMSKRRWVPTSCCWRTKLEKLANMDDSSTYRLGNLTFVSSKEFQIAKGSDGTAVFLGLRDDGTEVAVKRILKSSYQDLKNEEEFLRLPELDSPFIVRYVDFAEDNNFIYIVLQLCEYTLEEYIKAHLPANISERTVASKKIVTEVLCSLKVLHSQKTKVLHRDIKPQNVLIDVTGKARLSDFGISRRLKQDETTYQTSIAGTKCWKPKEVIDEEGNRGYKRSSDIQVAGMLVYYILSGGHHPFGKGVACEYNIFHSKFSLEHLEDDVAKDLVEWMINGDPKKRPTVEQTLKHPFFWPDDSGLLSKFIRRVDYLKKLGNQPETENCRNAAPELLHAIEKYTEEKTFSKWKTKFPPELVQKLDGKKKPYPENALGLLRFIRNLDEHYPEDAENTNLMDSFPDLFGSMYSLAKERGWNSRASLKKFFSSVSQI